MPARPRTKLLARSRTSSDVLSSNSTLVAPARVAAIASGSNNLLTHELGDVWLAEGPAEAFARKAYRLGRVGDFLALAGHHLVDRGNDLFRNALGQCGGVGRRRIVESGERAFGRRGWRDVFHVHHPRPLPTVRNAPRDVLQDGHCRV
jgi:hypothetical protein